MKLLRISFCPEENESFQLGRFQDWAFFPFFFLVIVAVGAFKSEDIPKFRAMSRGKGMPHNIYYRRDPKGTIRGCCVFVVFVFLFVFSKEKRRKTETGTKGTIHIKR